MPDTMKFLTFLLVSTLTVSCLHAGEKSAKKAEEFVARALDRELARIDKLPPAGKEELKKVLNAMHKAVDPKNVGQKITSATMHYTATVDGKNCAIDMRMLYKDPDKVKNIVIIPSMPDSEEAYNGKVGWRKQIPPGTVQTLSGRTLTTLKLQALSSAPGNKLSDVFPKIVLASGQVKLGPHYYYSLTCYPPAELKLDPLRVLVEAKTMRTSRTLSMIYTDEGPRVSETVYGEYRQYGEIYLPETMRTYVSGIHLNAVLRDCRFNIELDDTLFDPVP